MNKSGESTVAKRYRNMIISAFIKLTDMMPYGDITVLRIVQEAEVSRQTFYRHFKTKEDILAVVMDSCIETMTARLQSVRDVSLEAALTEYFTFWKEYKNFLRIVYDGHIESWLLKKYDETMQKQFCILRHLFPECNDREYHLAVSFLIGGLYHMKRDWYESGYRESPEELALLLSGLLKR